MLTGKRAFEGASAASVIAAIIERPAPSLGAALPPALEHVLQRSLAKDPDDRWQTARDLRAELQWAANAGATALIPVAKRGNRERLPWLAAAAFSALSLALLVFIVAHPHEQSPGATAIRFEIPAPDQLNFRWFDLPAVSPDGERIAFTANAGTDPTTSKLFVRSLNASAATPISIRRGALFPFWSPDGRQIAFNADRKELQKVDVSGGSPITLCRCPSSGGTWNRDGVLVVSIGGRLHRLPAAGGEPKPLGLLAKGETAQMWPQFLPDGKRYLYLSLSSQPDLQGIYVAPLARGRAAGLSR